MTKKSEAEAKAYHEALNVPRERVLAAGARYLRNYGPAELYAVNTEGGRVRCLLLVPTGFPNQRHAPIGWDVYESVAPHTIDAEETLRAAGVPK